MALLAPVVARVGTSGPIAPPCDLPSTCIVNFARNMLAAFCADPLAAAAVPEGLNVLRPQTLVQAFHHWRARGPLFSVSPNLTLSIRRRRAKFVGEAGRLGRSAASFMAATDVASLRCSADPPSREPRGRRAAPRPPAPAPRPGLVPTSGRGHRTCVGPTAQLQASLPVTTRVPRGLRPRLPDRMALAVAVSRRRCSTTESAAPPTGSPWGGHQVMAAASDSPTARPAARMGSPPSSRPLSSGRAELAHIGTT